MGPREPREEGIRRDEIDPVDIEHNWWPPYSSGLNNNTIPCSADYYSIYIYINKANILLLETLCWA